MESGKGRSQADSHGTANPAFSRRRSSPFFLLPVFRLFPALRFVFEVEFFAVRGEEEQVIGLPVLTGRRLVFPTVLVPAGAVFRLFGLPQKRGSADVPQIPLQARMNFMEIRFVRLECRRASTS